MKEASKEQQWAAKMSVVSDLLATYRAAKLTGATEQEATAVTAAYIAGLVISTREIKPDESQGEAQ